MSDDDESKVYKVLGGTAAGAAPLCLVDPTGAALAVVVGAGTGCLVGAGAHASKKVWNSGKRRFKEKGVDEKIKSLIRYERLVPSSSPNTVQPSDAQMIQVEGAAQIRKLAMSMAGIAVSGTISIVVPTALVGTAINSGQLIHQTHTLKKLTHRAGSKRNFIACVGMPELAKQLALGLAIKTGTTILFVGSEFDTWFEGINELTGCFENVEHTPQERYEQLPVLNKTTELASVLPGVEQESHGWGSDPIKWWDSPDSDTVLHVGTVAAAAEWGSSTIVELPINHTLDKQARKEHVAQKESDRDK